jgi:hypothetical protein
MSPPEIATRILELAGQLSGAPPAWLPRGPGRPPVAAVLARQVTALALYELRWTPRQIGEALAGGRGAGAAGLPGWKVRQVLERARCSARAQRAARVVLAQARSAA